MSCSGKKRLFFQAKFGSALTALATMLCSVSQAAFSEQELKGGSDANSDSKTNSTDNTKIDFSLTEAAANELTMKLNELVSSKYFDKAIVEKTWNPAFAVYKPVLLSQRNLLQFSKKANELLAILHTSHTQFLTPNDEAFYFMRSLFGSFNKDEKDPHKNDADFTGLGVGGAQADSNQVRYVLDASPAALAGFKRGDKILSVDRKAFSGYADWFQRSGKVTAVAVERGGKIIELKITPKKQDFLEGYVTATERSARVIEKNGKRIGYLHFWSGGNGSHDALEAAISEKFSGTDALILDLRDGYGGASLDDLDIFFRPKSAFPDIRTYGRGEYRFERSYYDKPLVALVNGGVRSGKELLAYGLKRSHRATLIGVPTAGFVVAGQFNPLTKNAILYLAVLDIKLDGLRLEGKGVAPDILLEDKLGADDPLLNRALAFLSSQVKTSSAPALRPRPSKRH
ncbi:MAG: hypothetical protein K2X27_01985 [Candidatus Obscuribacterales bacterium]|nr:hypothetical protein [Candidatus Obscuribacterales bacterium]